MDTVELPRQLLDQATVRFRPSGHFAYHYARGKPSSDCIFRHVFARGLLPANLRLLDLGCGQGVLPAWLLGATATHEAGRWPAHWPAPPRLERYTGIELMPKDVSRARAAFAEHEGRIEFHQGDICEQSFPRVNAVVIFDVLHYNTIARQDAVLKRVRDTLEPGGTLLLRVGDAAAGLPFHICNALDGLVTFVRGHRLPQLYCRPLSAWQAKLRELGFQVEPIPMSHGKPFANVLLVAHLP